MLSPALWVGFSCLLSSMTCATAQPTVRAAIPTEEPSIFPPSSGDLAPTPPTSVSVNNESATSLDDETPSEAMSDEAAAGFLLERAFYHFRHGDHRKAAHNFDGAVHTGQLNDAGRALAYWHIYLALRSHGDTDGSSDALASFVVVAEDILAMRDNVRYAIDDSGDFVERFDLVRRVARARGTLSATWAAHSRGFGRSRGNPVPVSDVTEINYFLEAAPPCADAADRQIWPTLAAAVANPPPATKEANDTLAEKAPAPPPIQKIQLRCASGGKSADYYFHVISQRDEPATSAADAADADLHQ